MIYEAFQQPGTFEATVRRDPVTGDPEISLDVWGRVREFDYFVVGPRGLLEIATSDAERLAVLKNTGGYIGVITQKPDEGSLSGYGLAYLLGDADGRGPTVTVGERATPASPSTWLDDVLPQWDVAKGSVSGGSSFAGVPSPESLVIDLVQWIAEQSECEWEIRQDATIDMAPSLSLFPEPTVNDGLVITKTDSSAEGDLQGVQAVVLTSGRDSTTLISRAVCAFAAKNNEVKFAVATQTPVGVSWVGFLGSSGVDRTEVVADPGEMSALRAAVTAANLVSRQSVPPISVSLTTVADDLFAGYRPGSRVWLHDLQQNLVDPSKVMQWQGQTVGPLLARVVARRRRIAGGKYLRLNGGAEWIDVSDVIDDEGDLESLEVTMTARRNTSPITIKTLSTGLNGQRELARMAASSTTAARAGGWVPSVANWNIGSGGSARLTGDFTVRAGGRAEIQVVTIIGSSGAGRGASGSPVITMPPGWRLRMITGMSVVQFGIFRGVAGGAEFEGVIEGIIADLDELRLRYLDAAAKPAAMAATLPAVWGTGDGWAISVDLPVEPIP